MLASSVFRIAGAFLLAAACTGTGLAQTKYTAQQVTYGPSFSMVGGAYMNNIGHIAGNATVAATGAQHAILWDGTTTKDLGTIASGPDQNCAGYPSSQATAINDQDMVVGSTSVMCSSPAWLSHAFMSTGGGTMTDLGVIVYESFARGVSNGGLVVGDSVVNALMKTQGFETTGGPMVALGLLPGGNPSVDFSNATAVNGHGEIVGYATNPTTESYNLVTWVSGGPPNDLGEPEPDWGFIPTAVNDGGFIVGYGQSLSDYKNRGFMFSPLDGLFHYLGDLGAIGYGACTPSSINSSGEVVGQCQPAGFSPKVYRAFYYSPSTGMVDLNSLVVGSNLGLTAAGTINNSGQILAAAPGTTQTQLYILNPTNGHPGLQISLSHPGDFWAGEQNATYTIIVSNGPVAGPTQGSVTVNDNLPAGLTLVSMSGNGWSCMGAACSQNSVLGTGQTYPPITVTVNVDANAASPLVNDASVQGGSSGPAGTTDYTTVTAPPNFKLALKVVPPGGGTLTGNPAPDADGTYPPGTNVCLTATPNPGWTVGSWSGAALDASNCLVMNEDASVTVTFTTPLRLVPITPCRVVDTRNSAGPFGGPAIAGGSSRDFILPNGTCGIPTTAQAYSLNAAMVPGGKGWITIWPTGEAQPGTASVNSPDGRVKSSGVIVSAGTGGAISVYASPTTVSSNVALDVNGYFVPASGNPTALEFYPLTPCRVADTRNATGTLGGPYMTGGSTRIFPVFSAASCNIPSSAQAFSFNITVVPKGSRMRWLTAWPGNVTQPVVSTLNDPPGVTLSNGVIVPAPTDNSGDVSIYVTDDTHVVIDIDGYFAPPGTGGLSLYTVPPCRVLDTRNPKGSLPFTGDLDVDVVDSGCGVPMTSQDYILNATIIPESPHGYLTMWAEGQSKPLAANVTVSDGTNTGNMALVPAGSGWLCAYYSYSTYLVLDLFGYFAP
jgi:uncharacterized repeat protein (TIGR01451 family)